MLKTALDALNTEDMSSKGPEGWAETATVLEQHEHWREAAAAWQRAKAASIGHKRRDRYYEAMLRCERKADGHE